jgi:hypothetical protein
MITQDLRWAIGVMNAITLAACANGGGPTMEDPGVALDPPPPASSVTLTVLFIGNSLTYTNDLPATLTRIAAGAGDRIRTEMVAGPKLTLMDHLAVGGPAEAAVRRGGWDFVVLQQGPSGDSASRALLVAAVRRFDATVRAAGAHTALYMVWPPADRPGDFCATRVAYATAAAAVNGVLLPAGVAWESIVRQHPGLVLYDPDGVHPAPAGTYLAAITIYETLTGHDARELSLRALVNGLVLREPASAVRLLQEAAHSASSGGTAMTCNPEPAAGPDLAHVHSGPARAPTSHSIPLVTAPPSSATSLPAP